MIKKNKKSQAEIIAILAILALAVVGGVGYNKIISENRYVGDTGAKIVYDLKFCEVQNIPRANLTSFEDKEIAYQQGYEDAECNGKK